MVRLPGRITQPMKTDYSFKLVAAIVFAGVIVAFFSPSHPAPRAADAAPAATVAAADAVPTYSHSE